MAQWDVYRNPSRHSRAEIPYLLQVQHDHLSNVSTRVVVPLARQSRSPVQPRLFPVFNVEGTEVRLSTLEPAAVPASHLVDVVTNLEEERHTIIAAIDYMIGAV